MSVLIDAGCRRPAPTWRIDVPIEGEQEPDRFANSWLDTFRRGVAQESREALELLAQTGLEVPHAHD